MGYLTDYTISVHGDTDDNFDNTFPTIFKEITRYSLDNSYELHDVKWYDWEKNMHALSLRFPDIVFQVDGNGESDGDIWRAYFMDGKMQKSDTIIIIEHSPFDKLK